MVVENSLFTLHGVENWVGGNSEYEPTGGTALNDTDQNVVKKNNFRSPKRNIVEKKSYNERDKTIRKPKVDKDLKNPLMENAWISISKIKKGHNTSLVE